MRFEGKRQSRVDKDIDVYSFVGGKKEWFLILDCLRNASKYTPHNFETSPMINRMKNIIKSIAENIKNEN
jgi:hypothetical protein